MAIVAELLQLKNKYIWRSNYWPIQSSKRAISSRVSEQWTLNCLVILKNMRSQKPFKIFIMLVFLAYLPSAFAGPQCARLFDVILSKISEVPPATKTISKIQDAKWIKKRLFDGGEFEKLKKSDLSNDHNEFLSELLEETTKMLVHDYYETPSELRDIVGAEYFLKLITKDIQNHVLNRHVTHDYFVKINYTIANLIALKNNRHDDFSKWESRIERVDEKMFYVYTDRVDKYFAQLSSTLPDGELSGSLNSYKKDNMYLLPTFAELTQKDFQELGVEIVPLGMTLAAKSNFDNLTEETALELFIHDLAHGSRIKRHWGSLGTENQKKYLELEKFLSSQKLKLNQEEHLALVIYFFQIIHEQAKFKSVLRYFSNSPTEFILSEESVSAAYKDLTTNPQYRSKVSKEEFTEILISGFKKAISQYQGER
jgi:hypothetical protein